MNPMLLVERLLAAAAVFVAAHFAMGFINASAGGARQSSAIAAAATKVERPLTYRSSTACDPRFS
jgi:hypothetical protein